MGLHVRTIMPYALPGVLALLACWWFFSRKKDRRSTRREHISACVDKVETDYALQESLTDEMHNSSRAQPVQLDKEEEMVLQEDCTCSLPLGAQKPLYSMQSYCSIEDDLVKESHLQTVNGFADQEVVEGKSPDSMRANEVAEVQVGVCTSSVLSQFFDGNKAVKQNSDTALNRVEKFPEPPCGRSQANDIQELSLKVIDQQSRVIQDSKLLKLCGQTDKPKKNDLPVKEQCVQSYVKEIKVTDKISPLPQAGSVEGFVSRKVELRFSEPSELIVPACRDQNQIHKLPCDSLNQQSDKDGNLGSAKPFSHSEDFAFTQSDKTNAVSLKALDVQPFVGEMQLDNSGSHVVQCSQSIEHEMRLACKGDVKLYETQCSKSILSEKVTQGSPMDSTAQCPLELEDDIEQIVQSVTAGEPAENCVKSSITEVAHEGNCTNVLGAFSKCNEEFENLCPTVEALKETNGKTFLGDFDAKIVEQLAINIISKVIVAARQEILSGSVDVSESSCQVLDQENRDALRDAQNKQLVPESDEDSVPADFTLGLLDFDCACESVQSEPSQNKDLRNTELTGNEFCVEYQREEKPKTQNTSIQMPSMSVFRAVHRTDFFDDSQPALEDSSLSVCTSEEGINMDDPLQSTVLSTVSSIGYDSLSSSGFELSRERFNVSSEKPKKASYGENEKELYSNGDIKRSSPDLNNEGPLTAESEVEHSGGKVY